MELLTAAHYWIGLTDEMIENEYVWIDTDVVAEYTDWDGGQPNDWHSQVRLNYLFNISVSQSIKQSVCESLV